MTDRFHLLRTIMVMILSFGSQIWCDSTREEEKKPSSCDGSLKIDAMINTIKSITQADFTQTIGNITYSLTMDGNLTLKSTTPTFHCSQILNQVESTNVHRTLKNVFGSGQLQCVSDPIYTDSTWVTQWTQMTFFGHLYIAISTHDGTCGLAPNVLGNMSPCTYNATSDGGFTASADCNWKITDTVHHLGDTEASQQGGDGSDGGSGGGGDDGGQ